MELLLFFASSTVDVAWYSIFVTKGGIKDPSEMPSQRLEYIRLERERKESTPTQPLSQEELCLIPNLGTILVLLEQFKPWAPYAFRLGILALLQECTQGMAHSEAHPELVNKARELVEALAHMRWKIP